jgi:hypothetical protein
MSALLIQYTDLYGNSVPGAVWSDAPKPGCKWVVPGDKPRRFVLVHYHSRSGKWSEVAQ